jgi:hypothetical protein
MKKTLCLEVGKNYSKAWLAKLSGVPVEGLGFCV